MGFFVKSRWFGGIGEKEKRKLPGNHEALESRRSRRSPYS